MEPERSMTSARFSGWRCWWAAGAAGAWMRTRAWTDWAWPASRALRAGWMLTVNVGEWGMVETSCLASRGLDYGGQLGR